jgi:hypothetical protein
MACICLMGEGALLSPRLPGRKCGHFLFAFYLLIYRGQLWAERAPHAVGGAAVPPARARHLVAG